MARGTMSSLGDTNVSIHDAYIAGQLDADGSIGIYEQNRRVYGHDYRSVVLRVTMYSQDYAMLNQVHESYGGSITRSHGCYYWLLTGDYMTYLNAVIPYMHTKKPQAELALAYKLWVANGGSRGSDSEKRFWFVQESKRLNALTKEAFNAAR